MRNLLSILIVVSLIPIPTLASDCGDAVKSAQDVIEKQDELIKLMGSRNEDLFTEKTDLERQLQDTQNAKETAQEHEILWGVIGVVAGVLATAYVTSRTK